MRFELQYCNLIWMKTSEEVKVYNVGFCYEDVMTNMHLHWTAFFELLEAIDQLCIETKVRKPIPMYINCISHVIACFTPHHNPWGVYHGEPIVQLNAKSETLF